MTTTFIMNPFISSDLLQQIWQCSKDAIGAETYAAPRRRHDRRRTHSTSSRPSTGPDVIILDPGPDIDHQGIRTLDHLVQQIPAARRGDVDCDAALVTIVRLEMRAR